MLPCWRLTLWLALSLLAGCAGLQPQEPTSPGWQAHRAQVEALRQWTATGKLALRTSDSSESAAMVWKQDSEHTRLHLSGPLGMSATTLESDGSLLSIRQGGELRTLDISSPEAIRANTGWDLPLRALAYWLRGLPAPEPAATRLEFDAQTGLLRELAQDGWDVRYQHYGQFEGVTLPQRLQIERGTTRVKVIVSQWEATAN